MNKLEITDGKQIWRKADEVTIPTGQGRVPSETKP
jgi:hypothetical protein